MANSYTDLITRLRQYDVPYSLRETAAASIEDLLALLREQACQCGQKHMIDSEDHFVHCRYRQLVEPAKAKWTKLDQSSHTLLDEIEEALERAYDPDASGWQKYQALGEVKSELWEKKEPLLAVVRAAAEMQQEHLDTCDAVLVDYPCSCGRQRLVDTIQSLDPRLLEITLTKETASEDDR